MQYELCRHIKTNGTRCKAPSLTDGLWCYFHHRLHQRHNTYRHTEATRGYLSSPASTSNSPPSKTASPSSSSSPAS